MNDNGNKTALGWIVGIVVVLALIAIAFFAFTGADEEAAREAERNIEEGTERAMTEAERIAARSEARAELLALEARVEADEGYDALADEVSEIRSNLAEAYEDAEGAAAAEFRGIDEDFARLETSLRTGTADVLEVFADLMLRLEGEVRTDEDDGT